MKHSKKIIACGLAVMLIFAGCGSTGGNETADSATSAAVSESADNSNENAENTVSGEITAVSEDSITIKTDDEEEVTIPVTDDTTVEIGMPEMNDMNGEVPEKPSDNTNETSNGTSENQSGEIPQKPSDDTNGTSDSSSEAPSGAAPSGEAPQKPSGDTNGAPDASGEAPEKPSDDTNSTSDNTSAAPSGEAPEKPSGDTNGAPDNASGEAPEMPFGDMGMEMTLSVSDLLVGETVTITLDDDGNAATITVSMEGGMNGGGGQEMGGQSQGVDSYTAVVEYSEDTETSGETYESTGTDENAVLISNGANVTIDGATVSRVSDESTGGDNSSFYGVGAAVLATDGTATVKDTDITTDANGGAGIFAYGNGIVYAINDNIKTTKDTSGGIHVAGGGTLYAWNVTAETNGESSAAIRSDRGGGTMVVDGGTYTSNGTGSPAVYCTADIAINNATLTANASEAVCIEGLNNLHLFDCDLTGSQGEDSRNETIWNVILYQSMSGDSEVGNSTFEMQDGTLSVKEGGIFYTTNTESTFVIKNVDITSESDIDYFLKVTGNSNERGWGSSGSNGANCTFTAIDQEMNGDIIWDSISTLDLYVTGSSVLTGAIIDDETNAGNGGSGYCNVVIADGAKWIVTGDSILTSLSCEGTIIDENGKTVTIKGTDGTVYVNGDSTITITVESYSDTADTSNAGTTTSWSDYEVEQP